MSPFEVLYLGLEPVMLPLYRIVRHRLIEIARAAGTDEPALLDVGGRKSHYTIGVPARVTVTDLPRSSELQERLNLGLRNDMISQTLSRRTNVEAVLLDDMTDSKLPSNRFHCVVAVEVIEHVAEDECFIREVHRVLRPGGCFLLTTPNGDWVPNSNPDHKRHYTRAGLEHLLSLYFKNIEIDYAVVGTAFRRMGLRSWSLRNPLRTIGSMVGNAVNWVESTQPRVKYQAKGTRHLLACARRQA